MRIGVVDKKKKKMLLRIFDQMLLFRCVVSLEMTVAFVESRSRSHATKDGPHCQRQVSLHLAKVGQH